MKLGGTYKFGEVSFRNFEKLGTALGFRPEFVKKQVLTTAELTVKCAEELEQNLRVKKGLYSPIYNRIVSIMKVNASQVLS